MKETKTCECCGAKLVEYRFSFNTGLLVFLRRLYDAGRPAKTDTLGLTYSQRTNSQKLRYWGLAEKVVNEEAAVKAGWWQITRLGLCFIRGTVSIPKFVWTFRGEVVRKEGPDIFVRDVADGWKYRIEYAQEAIAHEEQNNQIKMDL